MAALKPLADWEGDVYIYHGNGGALDDAGARSVHLRQRRSDGTARPIQPWGTIGGTDPSFEVVLTATHPDGRGAVKLEVEACPGGVAYGQARCVTSTSPSWTDTMAAPDGVELLRRLGELGDETLYRWRARVQHAPLTVSQPCVTAPAAPVHGPWRHLEGQMHSGAVRVVPEPGLGAQLFAAIATLAALARRRTGARPSPSSPATPDRRQ